jgi:hypothetical protein
MVMLVALAEELAALLISREGEGAVNALLPLIRELAMHIAGVAPCPMILRDAPELQNRIAVERASYRYAKSKGLIP